MRLTVAVFAAWATGATADSITLTNGRVIQADRAWFEGSQLRYEKDGGVYGLPRALVQNVDRQLPVAGASDPEVAKARERLAAQDAAGASRLLLAMLARDPSNLAALQALAECYLALGDGHAAREAAERALRIDARNSRSRTLLGDALQSLGDRSGAEDEYRRSLSLRPDPEVTRKLGQLTPGADSPRRGAVFRIRYDGGVSEPLGMAVLSALTTTSEEYTRRLGFRPDDPITVVLEMGSGLQDPRVPDWAAGVNDGTIRVPLRGIERLTANLVTVLRHELAHSFVAARTRGNCPTWLQEGISQWLEGGDPAREDLQVGVAARQGRLHPLLTLEAPFQALPAGDLNLAYAESLSAVAHILRRRGEAGVARLLSALSDGLPSEEALPVALALSYPEFQRSWEDALRGGPAADASTQPR